MSANARAVKCVSNLRNIGVAVNSFVMDNGGNLPTSRQSGTRTIMWTELLWNYLYDSKYVGYNGAELPASLAGTVFECPEAKYDRRALPTITNLRSYGMNHYLGDYNEMTAEVRAAVANPQTACLIADVQNESQLRPYTINPRHNDQFNALFVDGHVSATTLAPEMAELKTCPFWGVVK
jgi:prepilin-type processing-associated H-X9-DG protein